MTEGVPTILIINPKELSCSGRLITRLPSSLGVGKVNKSPALTVSETFEEIVPYLQVQTTTTKKNVHH